MKLCGSGVIYWSNPSKPIQSEIKNVKPILKSSVKPLQNHRRLKRHRIPIIGFITSQLSGINISITQFQKHAPSPISVLFKSSLRPIACKFVSLHLCVFFEIKDFIILLFFILFWAFLVCIDMCKLIRINLETDCTEIYVVNVL